MATWHNFQHNAVSFVVETTYLDWNTSFPAISICENEAPDKLFESAERLFGEDRNMNMDFFLRDITFFDGTCTSCTTHCGVTFNCTEDIEKLINEVRAPCNQFLDFCRWNGKPFDCCKYFLPVVTELGICYTSQSFHTSGMNVKEYLKSNRKTGPGRLDLTLYEAAVVYIHAPEDVPYINHPQEEKAVLNWGNILSLRFQVNEIENDPALRREVSVEQRNCRFPDENDIPMFKYYSYSTCVTYCRARAQIHYCNCTHHFMPKLPGIKTCTIEGLSCLTKYSETIRALRTEEIGNKGLVCNCIPSCLEPEYTVVSKIELPNKDYKNENFGSLVSIIMDSLPTQRFKRNVVRTRLDLVVSIGGTLGLFLGASLLSSAELIYYFFIRKKLPSSETSSSSKSDVINVKTIRMKRRHLDPEVFVKMSRHRTFAGDRIYPFLP
ncbi:hypothetical protein O3M35_002850 [Rhynocoris fuscipes]|uniref:Sodium channel protein Nach n=1 Tax=Rhynocoris fuscipes TaxID=488301 RepID=A0AAW1CLW2_9HEMI